MLLDKAVNYITLDQLASPTMSADEQYAAIIRVLSNGQRTTLEVEVLLDKRGNHCPDDLARTLNIMRRKGLIKGEVSTARGGWVWWVEDQP